MKSSFRIGIKRYFLLSFVVLFCHQINSLPDDNKSSTSILNKIISGNDKSVERRKAVTIGLNRWIRPLTIQVPDVISNLLPSSSNLIKVHDSPRNIKNETEEIRNDPPKPKLTSPILNYDPMQLLTSFDPNIFAKTLPNDPRFLPNSSFNLDEGTIANMMIPMNDSPYAPLRIPGQTMIPKPEHYLDFPPQNRHRPNKPKGFKEKNVSDGYMNNMDIDFNGPKHPVRTYQSEPKTELKPQNSEQQEMSTSFDDNDKDVDIKDKMSYYKKLISSFQDDFYKDKPGMFNDMNFEKGLEFSEPSNNGFGSANNADGFDSHFENVPTMKNFFNEMPSKSTMEMDGTMLKLQETHRHPPSQTNKQMIKQQHPKLNESHQSEQSNQYSSYYMIKNQNYKPMNNQRYMAVAASAINPVIVKPESNFNQNHSPPIINNNNKQTLSNHFPMILPPMTNMNVQSSPPRPVASRVKEFIKNIINVKF